MILGGWNLGNVSQTINDLTSVDPPTIRGRQEGTPCPRLPWITCTQPLFGGSVEFFNFLRASPPFSTFCTVPARVDTAWMCFLCGRRAQTRPSLSEGGPDHDILNIYDLTGPRTGIRSESAATIMIVTRTQSVSRITHG